ncbi:hypothetical protein M407DRAFT_28927 [Tulasnella calospora MUT 4182]|uniref:Uncharacterized protein n=1 Tax=Tulasnella calospora MUT 4182 TaxID=1051891 RepID=A0A0C3LJ90_9AGAM|nr:hypothetical protein M407DRAFT_28927 [Tulasnella calospora MUT 4182]
MDNVILQPIVPVKVTSEDATGSTTINSVLPSELFVSIFDDLYGSITDLLPFPLPYDEALKHFKRHPLLDYMLVCRRWCSIVQTSPAYWTFANMGITRGVAREGHDVGQGELIEAQRRLEKSGSLPLNLTIAPEFISDFPFMLQALEKHASRLETLNIVAYLEDRATRRIPPEDLEQLLKFPFPSLKRLYMAKILLDTSVSQMDNHLQVDLDAPELCQLFYHFPIILSPISPPPSRLTLLSISGSDFGRMEPHIFLRQIELPELLELRIARCDPSPILSTLTTPALQVLIFHSEAAFSSELSEELPEYPHLRDLQWSDVGPDATFEVVFQRCPSLTCYSNYVVGREGELDVDSMTEVPSIFEMPGGIESIKWPSLEEVLFDCTSCVDLLALVDLVPTIKRIRILKDPCVFRDRNVEKELLVKLREKIDVALWLDPWKDF